MLDFIYKNTIEFLAQMPKGQRKQKGQFFTSVETACFMAKMFNIDRLNGELSILDPGAGTGILSAAIIERLQASGRVSRVKLTCYEIDEDVLPILRRNLLYIRENSSIQVDYEIRCEDYLLTQKEDFNSTLFSDLSTVKYDLVIGNPPYLRIPRDAPAALAMPEVVHGAPNLYFLFAAMSLFNLKEQGEMVYIIPRSWTSGAYFKAFREYLLSYGKIQQIHLFVSRDKVFREESVLQETLIIKIVRASRKPASILITSSQATSDFDNIASLEIPYDSVVVGDELYVFLPTSRADIEVIRRVNRYNTKLPDVGLRMRTGIVVDFRQWDELREHPGEHVLPLFYSQHIRNGRVNHNESGKQKDWIIDTKSGLIQKNKNYVFCKRFTAKEEPKRLQCGIYLAEDFPEYESIGTQNKINYVDSTEGSSLSKETVYGVYAILNSTLYDMYYRILNGSTQVNSTEVNSIPVPSMEIIDAIGESLLEDGDLSTRACDRILDRYY